MVVGVVVVVVAAVKEVRLEFESALLLHAMRYSRGRLGSQAGRSVTAAAQVQHYATFWAQQSCALKTIGACTGHWICDRQSSLKHGGWLFWLTSDKD